MNLTPETDYANLIGMSTAASAPVKQFLRKIGSKGGKKSAQHPDRRRLNKLAAQSRWRKGLPEPKEIPK